MSSVMKRGSSRQWPKETAVFPELTPTIQRQLAERIYQLMLAELRQERERRPWKATFRR